MKKLIINANQQTDELHREALTEALLALRAIKNPDKKTQADIKTVQKELDDLNEHLSQFGEFEMTPEEIAEWQAEQEANAPIVAAQKALERDRAIQSAMVAEADPLYFKWKAGECAEQDWLDKRAEIRARFSE